MLADSLAAFDPANGAADVCVVGCGPAGLALAAELAANGVHVALVGELLPALQPSFFTFKRTGLNALVN